MISPNDCEISSGLQNWLGYRHGVGRQLNVIRIVVLLTEYIHKGQDEQMRAESVYARQCQRWTREFKLGKEGSERMIGPRFVYPEVTAIVVKNNDQDGKLRG